MTCIGSSSGPGFVDALSQTRISIPASLVIPKFLPLSPNSLVLGFLKGSRGTGYGGGIRTMAASSGAQMESSIKKKISENALVIYSKTRCPYCREVKALFGRLGVKPSVVEMDELVTFGCGYQMRFLGQTWKRTNTTTIKKCSMEINWAINCTQYLHWWQAHWRL